MLDIKYIREHATEVKANCQNRNAVVDIDRLLAVDKERRENLSQLEAWRHELKVKSKVKPTEAEINTARQLSEQISRQEKARKALDEEYHSLLLAVPNLSDPAAPVGGADKFVVREENGRRADFKFKPKWHTDLMTELDLIDFDRGTKVTGAKFYFLKNDAVRLNQALLNFGLDILRRHGFIPMETPDLVKNDILEGSGFNPRGAEAQTYGIKDHDLSLIGTAEITVLGYHARETLDLSTGPKKYAALSHCFRTEAGAYGKASRGLYRVHQFTKLEMFVFCKPADSQKLHQELVDIEKEICRKLELPFRVIDIPTADLGAPAYRKFDIEAYMVMAGDADAFDGYGEITSASNCTDYQARRLNIKYKNDDGVGEYVHTLNGTAIVTSRFPLAIIEAHQQKDGSIRIPKALKKYFGKSKIVKNA